MSQPPFGPPPSTPPAYGPPPTTPPPGYGPPPVYGPAAGHGAPPAAPSGKKPIYQRRWAQVVAGLFALGVVGSALSDGSTENSSTASDAPAAAAPSAGVAPAPDAAAPDAAAPVAEDVVAEPAVPGIGATVADGDFSFVVNGVDCSTTQIGDDYFNTTAQGQFCIVDLTVTNIGDQAQSFFGDNATLLNAEGQEFSADTEAAIYLADSASLYEEINPGNSLASRVVFDVPAGMTPAQIELHDSMFSGGVTVALG